MKRRVSRSTFLRGALALALVACKAEQAHPPIDESQRPVGQAGAGGARDGGGDSSAPSDHAPTVLVSNLPLPQAIALDPTGIYVATAGAALDDGGITPRSGSVVRVDRAGGGAQSIASGQDVPTAIAWAPGLVLLGNRGAQQASGGLVLLATNTAPRAIATGETVASIATDGTTAYWTSELGFAGIVVERAILANGGPDAIGTVQGPVSPSGMTIDATSIYFVGNGAAAAIYRVAIGGGNIETLVSLVGAALADIIVVGNTLYIADAQDAPNGSVFAMPITGGRTTPLATGQARPTRLAHDTTTLYWTNDVDDGDVMAVPLAGAPADAHSIAAHLDHPRAIAVDDAVYFTTASALLKAPR